LARGAAAESNTVPAAREGLRRPNPSRRRLLPANRRREGPQEGGPQAGKRSGAALMVRAVEEDL
jgi:hypothetical protein